MKNLAFRIDIQQFANFQTIIHKKGTFRYDLS